jgi:hypothetical protein
LHPAIRKFVDAPGTKPDRQFVPVEKNKKGEILFKNVPKGWSVFEGEALAGRMIYLEKDNFRTVIELKQVANVTTALVDHIKDRQGFPCIVSIDHLFQPGDRQVPRVVICEKGKAVTSLEEYRYFQTKKGAVCVELTMFDWPEKRTLADLLAQLRSHYGKFEGVCQQVAELTADKP